MRSPPDDIGLIVLPLALILAYGAARILSLAFNEARDAIFVNVAERAIRTIALEVFHHLHALSLRFHLGRQTGRLSQALDRGTRAVSLLLRFSLFSIIPTAIELVLVFVILWNMLDAVIALTTMATVVLYIGYTLVVTEWRIKFRRRMNEQEGRASNKSIDSLLNFETVKYFGNEAHESRRLDEALQEYERAAVMNQVSLSMLNVGQAAIIAVGLTAVMLLSAYGIVAGTMTIGGFVLANTYLMQLYQPLNVFGFIYREIKQALIDIEEMFGLLGESDENRGGVRRPRPRRRRRADRVRRRRVRIRPQTPAAPRRDLRDPGRAHARDRGTVRRGKVDGEPAAVPLLRRGRRRGADRRAGRARGHEVEPARGHRHRPPGHGAVQRHRLLQHRLRAAGRDAGGSRARGAARPHPTTSSSPPPTGTRRWWVSGG